MERDIPGDLRAHLRRVAHNECGDRCVVGDTSSFSCPHCDEPVYFEWRVLLPAVWVCPHCNETVTPSVLMGRHKWFDWKNRHNQFV